MKNRRYLVLALLGAVIIGISCYLFLSSFLDRVDILVLSKDLREGEIINEEDLKFKQYYKSELPDNYLIDKSEARGKKIFMDRQKDDFVSEDMLIEKEDIEVKYDLRKNEVLIGISLLSVEPILSQLVPGGNITIVSTFRDKSLFEDNRSVTEDIDSKGLKILNGNYISKNTINLSNSIIYIDGYIVIRNLQILDLERIDNPNPNILTGVGDEEYINIYLKCSMEEAPFISDLVNSHNYKIIIEGIS